MTHDCFASVLFYLTFSDTDQDEIEMINQNDYEIFLVKCADTMHVQVAPLASVVEEPKASKQEKSSTNAPAPSVDDPSNFTIHDLVTCDGCGLDPLIGFRYKCIQCSNFDLCQKCEAAHKHPEHLMIRMPTNNGPTSIDAWITGSGPSGRRCGRRSKGHCPFQEAAQAAPGGDPTRESRRERRHTRRHGGVLSQFVEMISNLPLNDTAAATATAEPEKPKATAPPPSAPKAEPTVTAQKAAETEAKPPTEPKKVNAAPTVPPTEDPVITPTTPVTTPTTPVINLENLSQMVPPEYMRAGIEILNNFSEMFAKMIDPSELGDSGIFGPSMTTSDETKKPEEKAQSSGQSTASSASQSAAPSAAPLAAPSAPPSSIPSAAPSANQSNAPSATPSISGSMSGEPLETEPLISKSAVAAPVTSTEPEEGRSRSESLDQDWQVIDNAYSANNTNLINLESTNPTAAPQQPVRDFGQLSELLRQHINEEARVEQATANTQTSQVDTVSTSTSTTSVSTNSVGTSPAAPEEKRSVPVYHTGKFTKKSLEAFY